MNTTCRSCSTSFATLEGGPADLCPRCTPTHFIVDARYSPTAVSPGGGAPPPAPALLEAPPAYEIVEKLGQGGMGYVVKARDRKLDRMVAIKMPLPTLLADPAFRDRFLREARAAARLRHPNICPIYEVGEHRNAPFIVLALIEGQTLREWVPANKPAARRSAEILALLARAVAVAHQHGVVHRDLKPANVMIERESGQPVLMDFGLAKETSDHDSHVTQTGQVVGTPAYMSPEQAAGRAEKVGPWSDLYSLGAILYELLTGGPPFVGTVGEVIHQVQHADPEPPRARVPTLHRDIETICLKALSKNPSDRYPDAEAMARDLEAFAAGEAIHARRIGPLGRLGRAVRRHPRTAAFAAVAVLVTVLGIGFFARSASRTHRVADLNQRIDAAGPEVEGLVRELEALDPEAAAAARIRVVRTWIRQPRLDADRRAAIEKLLPPSLRAEYQSRLSAWETVFELQAPFADLEAVFEKGTVLAGKDGLRARRAGRIATKVGCAGNVQVEAKFTAAAGAGIGVGGYAFVLRPGQLEVSRGEIVIRESTVAFAPEVDLRIQREGAIFTVRVGDQPAVTLEDVFPLSTAAAETFSLVLPVSARLTRLRAARQALPPAASPMETADDLYHKGRHDEALAKYREQAIQAGSGSFALEARYKEGVCLAATGRREDALRVFGELASETGDRWPLLALCHVWLLRVEQGDLEVAEGLLSMIQARYEPRQLAAGLPDDLRRRIVDAYGATSAGSALLVADATRVSRLERAVKVVDLLRPQSHQRIWVRWNLVRACHLDGDLAGAERHARAALPLTVHPEGGYDGWGVPMAEELAWILRLRGAAPEALELIDNAMKSPDAPGLRVERARIHAALERWGSAEAEIDGLFREMPAAGMEYRAWASAWLLRGALAERRGDAAAAQEAWRAGSLARWQEAAGAGRKEVKSGMDHHLLLVLGSLSGTMTQADVDRMEFFLTKETSGGGASRPQDLVKGMFKLTPEHLSDLFRKPRGAAYARDLAFLRVPLAEIVEGPARLLAQEVFGRCLKRAPTPEEEELAWETSCRWISGYRSGKILMGQLMLLGMTYKGQTDALGWGGLSPKLAPELRGATAYFLAFRLEDLGKAEPAVSLWKTAQRDSAEGSALRRLAGQELQRLGR